MKDIEAIIKKYTGDSCLSKEILECALWEAYLKGVEDGKKSALIETQELSPYEAENEQ